MRSPLDPRFIKTQSLMKSGMMVGLDRPVGRVTWAKQGLLTVTSSKAGIGKLKYLDNTHPQHELLAIRSIDITRAIGSDAQTCELSMYNVDPNSTQPEGIDLSGRAGYLTPGRGVVTPRQRSVFTDAPTALGPNLGEYPTTWGYPENLYRDVLIPNTVLRTYQGYGSDNFDRNGNVFLATDDGYVAPHNDSQLYLTGVWLIDQVTFGQDGMITVECRDLAKLLIEQYIYPPMIPVDRFPLIYCPAHKATGHKESIGANVASFHSSSVDRKYGRNRAVLGHRGSQAFDSRPASFWLSGPNPSPSNLEWLQAKVHGSINEVALDTWHGDYIAYVCVHEHGKWQGSHTITGTTENNENLTHAEGNAGAGFYLYTIVPGDTLWDLAGQFYGNHLLWPRIADINSNIIQDPHWIYPGQKIKIPYIAGTSFTPPANGPGQTGGQRVSIPYVVRATVPKSGRVTIKLPRTFKADYVRVVFTNLTAGPGGYRAGVRTIRVRNHLSNTFHPTTIGKAGYIQDWTEPIKELCAWAGLTWPDASPNPPDPVLGRTNQTILQPFGGRKTVVGAGKPLRVWGDFEILGAGPVVCTPGDYFLSKSFMEGIRQISDFIGGVFFIDESGGVQFRLPNIWTTGVFIDDTAALSSLGARISELPIEFHEDANLISYQLVISDASVRSEILVIGGYPNVNSKGPIAGGYVLGYNAATHTTSAIDFSNVLAGQYRLMVAPGDATKLFYTELECQRMAELIALFILFAYRQGSLHAPAHPGLQLDDQVRIFERITGENHIHYVSALRTHMDLESGEYSMDVTTHWLGDDPNNNWFVNKAHLTPAVLGLPAILKRVGREAGGDNFEQPPYGVTP